MTGSVVAGLPRWVGRRVVVRHRLGDGRATDALGTLQEVGATHLVLVRDRVPDGEHAPVRVALDDVVAAKPVPPAVPRRPPRP